MITTTTKTIFLNIMFLCGLLSTTTKFFGMELTNQTDQDSSLIIFIKTQFKDAPFKIINKDGRLTKLDLNVEKKTIKNWNSKILNITQQNIPDTFLMQQDLQNLGTTSISKEQIQAIETQQNLQVKAYGTINNQYYLLKLSLSNNNIQPTKEPNIHITNSNNQQNEASKSPSSQRNETNNSKTVTNNSEVETGLDDSKTIIDNSNTNNNTVDNTYTETKNNETETDNSKTVTDDSKIETGGNYYALLGGCSMIAIALALLTAYKFQYLPDLNYYIIPLKAFLYNITKLNMTR